MASFLRLVTSARLEGSRQKEGVFATAYVLLKSGNLTTSDHARLKSVLTWFEDNLPLPDQSDISPNAVFWFKASAQTLVKNIWELVNVLREHDVPVDLLKTSRPGYIIYDDEYQVAAVPFKDTP